jgi:acetaldehyde dehydrogenase/alcohol dehydrogenase
MEIYKEIDTLVANAKKALDEYMHLDQKSVDKITKAMAMAGLSAQVELAKLAIEETNRGIFEDKVIKNIFSTEYIWNSIKREKTVGIISENETDGYIEVADPVGIIAGVTPVTNPTSTTMFKSTICAKTRNPIIFAFHPSAQKCSEKAASILKKAAIEAGAPDNCIQWIKTPSIEATKYLMNHPEISTILATGGPSMVKAAYSSGKPAIGVGPGNTPCYMEKSCDINQAVNDLILSKSFDNGMICASEQGLIIDSEIYDDAINHMKAHNCYFATKDEGKSIEENIINSDKLSVEPWVVGKSCNEIADKLNIDIPEKTKIICIERENTNANENPISLEKLSPVLIVVKSENKENAFSLCKEMLKHGAGHTAVIHSENKNIIREFGQIMQANRIIVNSPATFGAIGDIYNSISPSLTLGCGSYGNNSVSENVTAKNLINKKKIAMRQVNMQWFKIPSKIYFESGSIKYLSSMREINRVFIVTDKSMIEYKYIDKVLYQLNKNISNPTIEVFSEIEPDPDITTVYKGVEKVKAFNPDTIIAFGGGSVIDAAKAIWLFFKYPDFDFKKMSQRFMDIRKKTYNFSNEKENIKMVAIPTTSGTGSEVTSFSVISDKKNNMKYPLADYELTPDVAIIDPQFVYTLPETSIAITGIDVLTHAIEAYVSVLANDYTDALAIQAIKLVFKYLSSSYKNKDKLSREKMHNASCIAGMAFSNAFLGINHSLAHKLGGEFHIPHGLANAFLLPHIIEYNGENSPTKFSIWPKYSCFIADKKYYEIAVELGLDVVENDYSNGVNALAKAVRELMTEIDIPLSIKEMGEKNKQFYISPDLYESKLDELAYKAFEDQCTIANPRLPLINEIKDLFRLAYGK